MANASGTIQGGEQVKVYIAGKITGCMYKENFAAAAFAVRNMGHDPVIPLEGIQGTETYKECIDHGLELLKGCDAIYMLANWPDSKGAILERAYAETVGLQIIEERIDL